MTRDEAWEPWLLYMLEAVRETARWTLAKIAAIRQPVGDTRPEHVRGGAAEDLQPRAGRRVFEQPYCRIAEPRRAGIAKRQTASRYLKLLAEIGVLEERKSGREKLFINPRLLALLAERDPQPAS